MARDTLPVALELAFGDEAGLQHSLSGRVSLPGAHPGRIAMRPAERAIIEWIATFAEVAFVASLIVALLP